MSLNRELNTLAMRMLEPQRLHAEMMRHSPMLEWFMDSQYLWLMPRSGWWVELPWMDNPVKFSFRKYGRYGSKKAATKYRNQEILDTFEEVRMAAHICKVNLPGIREARGRVVKLRRSQ